MKAIEMSIGVLAKAGLWLIVGGMTLLLLMALLSRTGRTVLRGLGDELEVDPLEHALAGIGEATTRWSRALTVRSDRAWRAWGQEDALANGTETHTTATTEGATK